jgi:hypothetical protein
MYAKGVERRTFDCNQCVERRAFILTRMDETYSGDAALEHLPEDWRPVLRRKRDRPKALKQVSLRHNRVRTLSHRRATLARCR